MIRRLLDRLADRLMDTAWLRSMRLREVQALRSAHHSERRARQTETGNPVADVLSGNRRRERAR